MRTIGLRALAALVALALAGAVPAGAAVVKVRLIASARRAFEKAGEATLRLTAKVGSAGTTATRRSTLRLRIVKRRR